MTNIKSINSVTIFDHINSAKGIAILMVILVHTSQACRPGIVPVILYEYCQMGVQLFFVVSALSLCLSADFRKNEAAKHKKYFIRRYFRVAPLYYLALIGYFVIRVGLKYFSTNTLTFPSEYSLQGVMMNISFLHGIFSGNGNFMVPGGWSIGVEMAFYAIFPVLYALLNKYVTKLNVIKASMIIVSSLCISIFILYIYFRITGTMILNSNAPYFNIVNQLPVFIVGMCYYRLHSGNLLKINLFLSVSVFMLFTFLSLLLWKSSINYAFSLIPVLSGVSFVFLIEILRVKISLNSELLMSIGRVSYSVYVIHFFLVKALSLRLAPYLEIYIYSDVVIMLLFAVNCFLSYNIALFFNRVVETSGINFGKKLINQI